MIGRVKRVVETDLGIECVGSRIAYIVNGAVSKCECEDDVHHGMKLPRDGTPGM